MSNPPQQNNQIQTAQERSQSSASNPSDSKTSQGDLTILTGLISAQKLQDNQRLKKSSSSNQNSSQAVAISNNNNNQHTTEQVQSTNKHPLEYSIQAVQPNSEKQRMPLPQHEHISSKSSEKNGSVIDIGDDQTHYQSVSKKNSPQQINTEEQNTSRISLSKQQKVFKLNASRIFKAIENRKVGNLKEEQPIYLNHKKWVTQNQVDKLVRLECQHSMFGQFNYDISSQIFKVFDVDSIEQQIERSPGRNQRQSTGLFGVQPSSQTSRAQTPKTIFSDQRLINHNGKEPTPRKCSPLNKPIEHIIFRNGRVQINLNDNHIEFKGKVKQHSQIHAMFYRFPEQRNFISRPIETNDEEPIYLDQFRVLQSDKYQTQSSPQTQMTHPVFFSSERNRNSPYSPNSLQLQSNSKGNKSFLRVKESQQDNRNPALNLVNIEQKQYGFPKWEQKILPPPILAHNNFPLVSNFVNSKESSFKIVEPNFEEQLYESPASSPVKKFVGILRHNQYFREDSKQYPPEYKYSILPSQANVSLRVEPHQEITSFNSKLSITLKSQRNMYPHQDYAPNLNRSFNEQQLHNSIQTPSNGNPIQNRSYQSHIRISKADEREEIIQKGMEQRFNPNTSQKPQISFLNQLSQIRRPQNYNISDSLKDTLEKTPKISRHDQ